MLEEDRVAVCGPRYAHQPARRASRAGHAPSKVVLGGRKVALRRPRVRLDGQEVALPSVQAFTNTDPLTWGTSRMLLKFSGGSVHDYATISDACRRTASRAAAKHPSSSPKTSRGCWVGLGCRPKTVPIWRMAGARPLARVRRRFAHRGRGPTGLRLAGRRRRLEFAASTRK